MPECVLCPLSASSSSPRPLSRREGPFSWHADSPFFPRAESFRVSEPRSSRVSQCAMRARGSWKHCSLSSLSVLSSLSILVREGRSLRSLSFFLGFSPHSLASLVRSVRHPRSSRETLFPVAHHRRWVAMHALCEALAPVRFLGRAGLTFSAPCCHACP